MESSRKIILYVACTLDGFIAGPEDNLDFLSVVEKPGEDYGYSDFIKTVDTVIMGNRTYEWILKHAPEFVHEGVTTYVYTRTPRPSKEKVIFYNGSLTELALNLKKEKGKNIFCEGGALVANIMLNDHLIDEFIISVIPVILGKGIRLFGDSGPQTDLKLVSVRSFDTGLVQMEYQRR